MWFCRWIKLKEQMALLACILLLGVSWAWCADFSLDQEFSGDINERLDRLQIYFEAEMYEEALETLEQLRAQFPEEPRFRYLQAIVDYQLGNYERAQEVFLEFVRTYPDTAESYYLLGEINLKQGDLKMAKEYFSIYSSLVPGDKQVLEKISLIKANISSVSGISIIKDGQKDVNLVEKVGFYGACIGKEKEKALQLTNGSFCSWSSLGIDFVYPLDLRGKRIKLTLKGKHGGEGLELTLRDKFAPGYEPQLVIPIEKENISRNWDLIEVELKGQRSQIDLSQVVHLGLEFGSSTAQNPANSVLYLKDIIIEDDYN